MPDPEFFPPIRNLISADQIPTPLSELEEGLDVIFSHLYYKDHSFERFQDGTGASLRINLVSYKELGVQIPGTNGVSLILNPGIGASFSEIPIFMEYKIEALKYIRGFSFTSFPADETSYFDLFKKFSGISKREFLNQIINRFISDADPIQKFANDFNTAHPGSDLIVSTDPNINVVLSDIIVQIENIPLNLFLTLYEDYIVVEDSFEETFLNITTLYNSYFGPINLEDITKILIPQFRTLITDLDIAVTFPRTYLLPLDASGEVLPEPEKSALACTVGKLKFSSDNGFEFVNETSFSLTKSQIGNTGLVLEVIDIKLDFSQSKNPTEVSAAGYPNDFVGVFVGEATIDLPAFWIKDASSTAEIKGRNLIIGTGGFSGTIYLYMPDETALLKTNLGTTSGFYVELNAFDISFLQGAIISSNIVGKLTIPKFNKVGETGDVEIDIIAHIGTDGDFSLTASVEDGFTMEIPDVLQITINSLSAGKEDDRFFVEVSGSLDFTCDIPFFGEILPTGIDIKKLRIWDDGTIEFVGGNLILPQSFNIKLGPAEFSISSMNIGSYEQYLGATLRKYNYFGFNGGIGIDPGGVEVTGDGLKFFYSVDGISPFDAFLKIEGIGIDISIPDSDPQLILNGYLYMQNGPAPDTGDIVSGDPTSEYMGGISFALPKLKLAGTAGMRYNPSIPSFIVDVGLELPVPIPIAPTPLGIYGFRGLIGQRYVANRPYIELADDASWYEYYKKHWEPQPTSEGIHIGKFAPEEGFSLGVGASIATTPDQGKAFSSKVMFLLSLPEVFLIQGQAGILRKRLLLDSTEDPPFSALLAVTDESIEAAFGITYNLPEDSGNIAKVNALIEVAFFFTNSTAWYVNIGRDLPEEKRVSARLLTLFDAYFYFMLNNTGIRTGAGWSFELDKKFGPVGIEAGIYFDVAGKLAFKPVQVGGSVALGGYFRLVVFGFKFGLSASASLSAEAPKPFMITGTIQIGLELPWPFDDITVDIEFTWVFNTDIDTSEIAAFNQESTTTAEAVKSVNIITGETFAVKYIDGWDFEEPNITNLDDNYVIPMDAYINIELAKPVNAYDASLSNIGGIAQPPLFTDYIAPQKAKSDRARHEFLIDSFVIYSWDPDEEEWKPFDMGEANTPLQNLPLVDGDALDNIKDGYWQIFEPGKYNKISLLSRDPLAYLSATTGDVVPEEMGITTETIFCTPIPASDICITFTTEDTWDGSGSIPAGTVINHEGLVFYLTDSDGAIVDNTLCGCMTDVEALSIDGADTLEILFPISAPKITLCLGTQTSDVTLEFYKKVTGEDLLDTGLPSISYELITSENLTSTELASSFTYEDVENSVDKILIKSGTCSASNSYSNTAYGSQLITFLSYMAGNGTPQYLTTNTTLGTTFTTFRNTILYPYVAGSNTISYSVLTSGYTSSSILQALITDSYGYSCPITLETVSGSTLNWTTVTGFTNIKPDPAYDTGGLIYHFLITGLIGSTSTVALKGSSCYPVGTIDQGACKTQICKICYQDYPTYVYNESIIDEEALDGDIESMIEGLNGTIQPIWRPDTIYTVAFSTKDRVFLNEDPDTVEEYSHSYAYQFRTKGPIGHFHLYRTEYNNLADLHRSDEFKLQSLKYYVDFSKSYPNADGNILNAKPLYYENPKLLLFYINGYVYEMFATWDEYNGNPAVELSLQVIIKDPIKITADESEIKVLGTDNWKKNSMPVTPTDIELLDNMLANGDPCADIPDPLDPLDVYSEVSFESLKPLKLYTAIWSSVFDEKVAEILKYGFQTSRYANFEVHINSYILSAIEGSETYAIFRMEQLYTTGQIDDVISVLNGTMDETDSLIQQFQERYDRIIDGILKMGPIAPAVTTEFNVLVSDGKIIGVIIRSPEPFNDPKTPLTVLEGAIKFTINADDSGNYIHVYSKDKSKVFISNSSADLATGDVSIDFKYLLFNGIEYDEESTVNVSFVIE